MACCFVSVNQEEHRLLISKLQVHMYAILFAQLSVTCHCAVQLETSTQCPKARSVGISWPSIGGEFDHYFGDPSTWNTSSDGVVGFTSPSSLQSWGTTPSLNCNVALLRSGQSSFTPASSSRTLTPKSSRTPSSQAVHGRNGTNCGPTRLLADSQMLGAIPATQAMLGWDRGDGSPMPPEENRVCAAMSIYLNCVLPADWRSMFPM
ncbi:hypothetical protein CLAIMM_07697 [Cladophialophora immunda]|nr:hypothetical protein CLAIMM_07697 [Cladophialophora immunda]